MKGRKQKTSASVDGCPKKNRTESEDYWGEQTFMWISANSHVTVQPTLRNLLGLIVSPKNLNNAYLQVKRNGGAGGIDRMDVEALQPYLQAHREELIASNKLLHVNFTQ